MKVWAFCYNKNMLSFLVYEIQSIHNLWFDFYNFVVWKSNSQEYYLTITMSLS